MQHMVRRLVCLATVAGLGFGALAELLPTGDYIKDGLVAQWDAIDNVGTGTHDPTATKWVDKVGGVELVGAFTVGEKTMAPSADITGIVTGLWELAGYTVETLSRRTDGKGLANSGFIATPRISMGYTSNGPDTFCVSLASSSNVSWMRYYFGSDKPKQHALATRTASYVVGAAKASGQPVFYYDGVETASSSLENWTGTRAQNNDVKVRSGTTYHSVRIYNRVLSAEEVEYNYAVDQKRFFGNLEPISKYERLSVQPIESQTFTGAAIMPDVQVGFIGTDPATPLTKDRDYTVTCENNVGLGTARMTITGIGAYKDEIPLETTFNIVPPPADERIRLEGTFEPKAVTFGSAAKIRDLRVLGADGQPLADGTYEVNYLNNTATGTATVWARGTSGTAEGALAAAAFDVKVLPEGYTHLEYIESTASNASGNQYILLDTTYNPTASTVVEAEVAILDKSFNQSIFCARGQSTSEKTFSLFWINGTAPSRGFRWDYNCNTLHGGWDSVEVGTKVALTCKSAGLWIDGDMAVDTSKITAPASTGPMMLFASYSSGNTGSRGNYAKIRLYSFKVYDGDTLKFDLVPCFNTTSQAVLLYDVANDKPYPNQGTTPFKAGPEMSDYFIEPSSLPHQRPDGTEKRPVPVIIDRLTGEVVPAENFTYSYANNIEPGTARVTAAGVAGTPVEGVKVYATFIISRLIFATFEGAGTQDGTSWENAMAPQAALTAAQTEYDAGGLAQVFFKAGNYPLTAALTLNKPAYVYGGCLGASGTSLELDPTNPETTFDGQGLPSKASEVAQAITVSSAVAGKINHFERCGFGRFVNHGFVKTGASDIRLVKCRIFNNTWGKAQNLTGRGFNMAGTADTMAVMEDCEVFGNGENGATILDTGSGFGGYFSTFKRITIDNCHFVTNGWGGDYRAAAGAAIYVNNAPVTIRHSEFIGNRLSHPGNGGTIYLNGNCGGSALTNCLFLANCGKHYGAFGTGNNSGAVHCHFTSVDQTIDLDHCTFAYNLQGAGYTGYATTTDQGAAAGLDIFRGAAKVRNCIFWGNSISSDDPAGADVYVYSGSADIDYTLFGGLSTDYLRAYAGAAINLGEHVVVGDPQFVSRPEQAVAAFSKYASPRSTGGKGETVYSSRDKTVAFDAHLVSTPDVYSRAIDMANPSEGVVNEPDPNGGIANLGYYGNTAEAARSILGTATLAASDIEVAFPDGLTSPRVSFALGSGDEQPYNARVTVYVGDDWSQDLAGIRALEMVTVNCPLPFEPGTDLQVRIVVSVPGHDDIVVEKSVRVEGQIAPWTGHGGDPSKVVHVRAGSTAANPKGTSWTDAYPTLEAANGAPTETRNEIWFAGTLKLETTPPDFTASSPMTIRGGFTGVEDTLEERTNAVYSTLDGQWKCTPFVAMNSKAITFERVCFTHGTSRAVYHKSSNGGLSFDNCAFICNGATNATAISGAAVYYAKGDYAATDHVFTNCLFEGNGRTFSSNAQLDGACIYMSGAKSLTVSDCTFLTNGAPFSLVVNGTGCVRPVGTCVYASATPCVIERCRFAGNRTCCYKTEQVGGLVYFTGKCDDSVVRNCAFVGNECVTRTNTKNEGGSIGGMIVANLGEAIRNIYVENCTFAWDFASGLSVPADICAHKGVVNVKNSIFFGGQVGDQTAAGTGRYLNANADGTVNVAYSMFDVAFTNAAGAAGVSVEATCMTNTPAFVTASLDLPVWRDAAANVFQRYTNEAERVAISGDVHLLSPAGYWDNAGEYHEDADRVSPAIDAGDPADDCSNEPTPNGGFINLGAYGNTTEASKTVVVRPEIADDRIDVTFPNNTSLPNVAFDLKSSSVDYTAVATVYCGAEDGVWDASSPALPIRGGEHFSWQCLSAPYPAGTTVFVKVVITSGDYVVEKTVTATASGEMPKWHGKGGGARVLHVWADAPGAGTGANWRDAFRTFDEAIDAFDPSAHDEIWVCGDYTLGKTGSFSPTAAFAVRGGFDACEDGPEERAAGTISHLDGFNSYNAFVLANGVDAPVTIDRISADNCFDRGIDKTGAGDLMIVDCVLFHGGILGTRVDGSNNSRAQGKGLRVRSAAGANVRVSRTTFDKNRLEIEVFDKNAGQGNGSGIYMDSGASLTVEDCVFTFNGHPLIKPSSSHSENPRCGSVTGGAIYTSVPTTIAGSRFCGNANVSEGTAGGVVALRGAAGGSIIRNCVFAGNMNIPNGGNAPSSDCCGAIAIYLTEKTAEVEIVNCTFAYNISGGKTAAAGITVNTGVANVRNCVFGGNRIQATGVTDVAKDINVRANGTCNISYSVLSADDKTSYAAAVGGVWKPGEGMMFGDPLFVTPESAITPVIANINADHIYYDTSKGAEAVLQAIDVHEKSCGGYFNNAGDELHDIEEGVISMAVDGGNTADSVGDEPDPNGGRINAGAYGGTAQASMSATGAPAVDGDIAISFPDGTTRPEISFTVGGEGTFLATAEIYLSSDGGETWTLVRTQGGLNKGQLVSYYVPAVYQPTDRLVAKVVLTGGSSGGGVEKTSDVVVPSDKKLPDWYGHGGDSNKVIHVRADAFGDGSGRDWGNAVNGFHAAMAMLTAERNEIWLAVSNVNDAASKTYAPDFPIVIRGGFAATEDRIEERADGVRSFIDGEGKNNNLVLANVHPVYIERIEFLRGSSRAFEKSASAGDLTMVDCAFLRTTATPYTDQEGRGGRFVGDSGKTATLALTNCVFAQNSYVNYGCTSIAAYFRNFKDVFLDNCLFATNGVSLESTQGSGNNGATCFSATGARITATNCRFIGNNARSATNGGTIYLTDGCSGSVFRNCRWVGNLTRRNIYDCTTGYSGGIYVAGSFQERMPVLFENCTFAYNVTATSGHMPGVIRVKRGHVTVRNCIFHGNAITTDNKAPADIYVDRDAEDAGGVRCTVEYTMFDELTTNCYAAAEAGLLDVKASCFAGDPLFVTSTEEFFALVNMGSKTPSLPRMPFTDTGLNFRNDAASLAKIVTMNVHLRGGSGYVDEKTGETVKAWTRHRYGNSPAIDAGDPAVKCVEPYPNRRCVNMGAYGNTPWATMSPGGTLIFVR